MNLKKLITHLYKDCHESIQARIAYKLTRNSNYYGYIPSYDRHLYNLFEDITKNVRSISKKKFIDIGCGFPLIPKIADILGFNDCKGLEFEDLYVKLDESGILIHGDLLNYDFKDYDVLYSYNPIRDIKLMNDGLRNIINTMKPGAIFYFADAGHIDDDIKLLFIRCYSLWKYQKPLKDFKKI